MVIVLLDSSENMALPYFMLYQVDKSLLLVPDSFGESWPSGGWLLNLLSTSILKFQWISKSSLLIWQNTQQKLSI